MTFDDANQRRFGMTDVSFAHLLHIEGQREQDWPTVHGNGW